MKKGLSILSGGLDSAVATVLAQDVCDIVLAVTFDYGQKAAQREIESAKIFSKTWGIEHLVLRLDFLSHFPSALTCKERAIPQIDISALGNPQITEVISKAVWVPNRNGTFVNIAAAIAESRRIDFIVAGFNKEEALTFPDNSKDFLNRVNSALELSTQTKVKIISPTIDMDKTEILRLAIEKNINVNKLWVCYDNQNEWCKKCESCTRFMRGMDGNKNR